MNEISKDEIMLENNKNIIALLGENDFFSVKQKLLKPLIVLKREPLFH
ncbi:MAG: hypothetical protein ACI8WT_001496 [Clostridium sp.]|jgi:hypothetical protein